MKSILALINLIICFEFIVAPLVPNLRVVGSGQAMAQGSCPEGLIFDTRLKRCISSNDSARAMNHSAQCADDSLYPAQADKERCYKTFAKDEQARKMEGDIRSLNNGWEVANTAVQGAALAVMMLVIVSGFDKLKENKCAAWSYGLMMAAGLATFAGELIANYTHGSRLDNIEADWSKIVNPEAVGETDRDKQRQFSTEAQKQAFYQLAKREDSTATAAQMKTWFYAGASVAYGAAAGFAIYEMIYKAADSNSYCYSKQEGGGSTGGAAPTPDTTGSVQKGASLTERPMTVHYRSTQHSDTDWESDIMIHKHGTNLLNAQDMASYYILTQAANKKYSSPTLDEYESIKNYTATSKMEREFGKEELRFLKEVAHKAMTNINPFPEAHADEQGKARTYATAAIIATLSTLATGAVIGAIAKEVPKFLTDPTGRLVFSLLMVGWSVAMIVHLQNVKSDAKDRAAILRKLGDNFAQTANAISECKSEDRKDPGKPNCYCYTADGERNPSRGNSKICLDLWNGNTNFGSGDYTADGKPKGCIDSNGQPDEKCSCRKSSRKCLRATPDNLNGMNLGSFKMLASGGAPVDQLGNGTFNAATASPDSLANQAMRLAVASKKLMNNPNLKVQAASAAKMSKDLNKFMGQQAAAIPPAPARSTPSDAQAAVAALEKDIKERKEDIKGALDTKAQSSSGKPALEFGMSEEDLAAQQGQVAEAMKQDLNFGQNDISAGKNLFEVLSNRYQRSGMRRLFDEEGKAKAEKPAETDINK